MPGETWLEAPLPSFLKILTPWMLSKGYELKGWKGHMCMKVRQLQGEER